MPTDGGILGSLLHAVPVPLPVVRSPPLHPRDGDPWGPRSGRNGRSQPQLQPPRAQLGTPPHPPHEPTPPRSARVSPAPAALPARSQPQWRPREHNWDRPPPKAIGISTRAARVYPVPGALPARFQPQCPPPRAQLGSPPPPPPEADSRPMLPAFTPALHGPGTCPASSVHARVGSGCRSMGDVSGA